MLAGRIIGYRYSEAAQALARASDRIVATDKSENIRVSCIDQRLVEKHYGHTTRRYTYQANGGETNGC